MSSCSDDEGATIVFDIGSHCARAGFAGDDEPSVNIKYVDCPEFKEKYCNQRYKLYYPDDKCDIDVLDEVISKCIGSISNYAEDYSLKDNGILLTENFHDCPSKREKLAELLFEKYEVASLYMAPSPVLSLYSSGRGSGIVVESGNSVTQTAVIYEGFMFANSVLRKDGAGDDITDNLRNYCKMDCRKEKVNYIFSDSDYVHIKEKYSSCFEAPTTKVELPDGTTHSIKSTYLSDCTEYFSTETLPNMVYKSIMASNIHTRKHLFSSIILSGGNTKINGLPEKLRNRLDEIVGKRHKGLNIKVVAPPERLYSPWIGGSIIGSLSCFMGKDLSREMYQECGPKAIHERCINPADSIQS